MATKTIYRQFEGNYKGWSFLDDAIDSVPSGFSAWGNGGHVQVAGNIVGEIGTHHNKVCHVHSWVPAEAKALQYTFTDVQLSGIVEYYGAMSGWSAIESKISLTTAGAFGVCELFFVGDLVSQLNTHFHLQGINCATQWNALTYYHISLGWRATGGAVLDAPFNDLAVNTCRAYINDVAYGDYALTTDASVKYVRWYIGTSTGANAFCVDSIGIVNFNSYTVGLNKNLIDGTEFIAKVQQGSTVTCQVQKYFYGNLITSEVISEGETVKIYDEAAVLMGWFRLENVDNRAGIYTCEIVDKSYSDYHAKCTLDYSTVATSCETIAKALIDLATNDYGSYDAGSMPDPDVDTKIKYAGTEFKDAMTVLAWEINGLWYQEPGWKLHLKKLTALTDSGIAVLSTSQWALVTDVRKCSTFVNSVQISGANGLTSAEKTSAASIAQYGKRRWSVWDTFPMFVDQTYLDQFAQCVLDLSGVGSPNYYLVDLIIVGQHFIQPGKTLSVTNSNYPELIVTQTLPILQVEHSLVSDEARVIAGNILVKPEVRKDHYIGKEIRAIGEIAVKASGDIVNTNAALALKTVTVNGQYTGDGTGNGANWNAGAYKEIDLSAYCSSLTCVMLYADNVASGTNKAMFMAMNNDASDICHQHVGSGAHNAVAFALRIVSGGKFQVADQNLDYPPNVNGTVYNYVAWGVKT